MSLFLVLHLCSSEPCLSVAKRCDDLGTADDPGPWWITPLGGWRVYPVAIYNLPPEAGVGLTHINFPNDAIDTYAANGWVERGAPKVDLTAMIRKHFPREPIRRRI